jgi:4-hydroxy-tetrahydrodipicolinate reductase
MGKSLSQLLASDPAYQKRIELAAAGNREKIDASFFDSDVVIDFSTPEAVIETLQKMPPATPQKKSPAWVIGSTGWSLDQKKMLEAFAEKTPLVLSANFSLGVLALFEVLKFATPLFDRLGYTATLVESHHRHKKDAPSGTALSIQRIVSPSGPGNLQTHSIRAGEIIGRHEVTFHGPSESVSLGHEAQDRGLFSRGALECALWLHESRNTPGKLESFKAKGSAILRAESFFQDRYLSAKT